MAIPSLSSANSATQSSSATLTPAAQSSTGTIFSETLARNLEQGNAVFISGRIGIGLDLREQPARVIYFDTTGKVIDSSIFSAQQILEKTTAYDINLNDLTNLGEQLDAADIGYRPYELYKGTGSDHGIDFADLVAGGMGTAYDWRQDVHVAQKGSSAKTQLAAAQKLSESLGIVPHPEVTHNRGIDPAYFAPLGGAGETPRTQVMFNGNVAAWYQTAAAASAAAAAYGGRTIDLTQKRTTDMGSTSIQALPSTPGVYTAPAERPSSTQITPAQKTEEETLTHRLQAQLQSLVPSTRHSEQRISAIDSLIESLMNLRNQE